MESKLQTNRSHRAHCFTFGLAAINLRGALGTLTHRHIAQISDFCDNKNLNSRVVLRIVVEIAVNIEILGESAQ